MSEASNNLRHWAALTRMSGYNISADDFEAAADEIERLMAENASLWERVRRWEPMADPNWHCSGSLEFKEFKGAKSDE